MISVREQSVASTDFSVHGPTSTRDRVEGGEGFHRETRNVAGLQRRSDVKPLCSIGHAPSPGASTRSAWVTTTRTGPRSGTHRCTAGSACTRPRTGPSGADLCVRHRLHADKAYGIPHLWKWLWGKHIGVRVARKGIEPSERPGHADGSSNAPCPGSPATADSTTATDTTPGITWPSSASQPLSAATNHPSNWPCRKRSEALRWAPSDQPDRLAGHNWWFRGFPR